MDISTFLFLLRYSLAKNGTFKAYRESIKFQNLSKEEQHRICLEKESSLLKYAFGHVPFYREFYRDCVKDIENYKSSDQFQNLPVLTRNELVQHYEKFISKKVNPDSLKISTTGGSTGTPVKIGMNPNLVREVPKWQMFSWWGLSPLEDMATVYRGLPVKGIKKAALDVINWPQKTVRLDATDITEDKIKHFILACQKVKPKLIHGYVGAVDAIADYILDHQISFPSPKVIWTTAAPVSAVQTSKIEKAFGAPVCDQYGCSELYFIAAECPAKEGLHIFSDSVKVEILDENDQPVPDGEYGRIVISNLNDHAFPLIRYANGDIGRRLTHECSCGIKLPLLDKVKGRVSDNLILPDGTVLSGEYLTTIFDDYTDEVKQFQIVQEKSGSILVKVVFHDSVSVLSIESIIKVVRQDIGSRIKEQVPFSIKKVLTIPMIKGKLQFIIKE